MSIFNSGNIDWEKLTSEYNNNLQPSRFNEPIRSILAGDDSKDIDRQTKIDKQYNDAHNEWVKSSYRFISTPPKRRNLYIGYGIVNLDPDLDNKSVRKGAISDTELGESIARSIDTATDNAINWFKKTYKNTNYNQNFTEIALVFAERYNGFSGKKYADYAGKFSEIYSMPIYGNSIYNEEEATQLFFLCKKFSTEFQKATAKANIYTGRDEENNLRMDKKIGMRLSRLPLSHLTRYNNQKNAERN